MAYAKAYGIRITASRGTVTSMNPRPGRSRNLSRTRIVDAAIELADTDGLAGLSMARLADKLGCGTMSLYRHVATKDELQMLMTSVAVGAPPAVAGRDDWQAAVSEWADGLWEVYHRHPWILAVTAAYPPVDPGQLAWLDAGLAALSSARLAEHHKVAAVMAVLHYTRGAAALDIDATRSKQAPFTAQLHELVESERFPALSAAVRAGAFDGDGDRMADFHSGLRQLLDGVRTRIEK